MLHSISLWSDWFTNKTEVNVEQNICDMSYQDFETLAQSFENYVKIVKQFKKNYFNAIWA